VRPTRDRDADAVAALAEAEDVARHPDGERVAVVADLDRRPVEDDVAGAHGLEDGGLLMANGGAKSRVPEANTRSSLT